MADLIVDVLEVVEVEDDQREPPVVPMRAGHFAGERLVEEAPVVESRQRIEIRELPCLAEAPRILNRRARADRECLEVADVVLAELLLLIAREDREVPHR